MTEPTPNERDVLGEYAPEQWPSADIRKQNIVLVWSFVGAALFMAIAIGAALHFASPR